MFIYLFNYLSIFLYFIIFDKKSALFVSSLQMWVIMILRSSSLGTDMSNYIYYYNLWGQYSLKEMIQSTRFFFNQKIPLGLESGYVWLNWICFNLGLSFKEYLNIHSTICLLSSIYFFNYSSEKPVFLILLFISFGCWESCFNILRQSLALSILLLAVRDFYSNKRLKLFIKILIAVLFHRSAIVFLLVVFLAQIQINKRVIWLFLISCLLEVLLIKAIYGAFSNLLELSGKENLYSFEDFTPNRFLMLLYICLLIVSKQYFKDESIKSNQMNYSFWFLLTTIFLQNFSLFVPIVSRVSITLTFPFAMPLICYSVIPKKENNRIVIVPAISLFLLLFYIYVCKSSSTTPYYFFWSN